MRKPKVIAVVGSKKSGKTTTAEHLIAELTKRGYKVAAVKHVSEPDFTIDTVGKDTWRFSRAGAKTIVSVAASEVATIEKFPLKHLSLPILLERCKGNDFVLIEGLKEMIGKERNVQKIVVVKEAKEALNAMRTFKPVLAFSGPFSTGQLELQVPYADATKNPDKLVDIVERAFSSN